MYGTVVNKITGESESQRTIGRKQTEHNVERNIKLECKSVITCRPYTLRSEMGKTLPVKLNGLIDSYAIVVLFYHRTM